MGAPSRTRGKIRTRGVITILASLSLLGSLAAPSTAYQRPGNIEIVSVSSSEKQGRYCDTAATCIPSVKESSSLSASGRFIAFASSANDLADGVDANRASDVFVRDRRTDKTEIVSVSTEGTVALGPPSTELVDPPTRGTSGSQGLSRGNLSYDPSISSDGRFVAFTSIAINLVTGDTNLAADVFVHDREKGTTERVSVSSEGTQGAMDPTKVSSETLLVTASLAHSFYPSISADGRYVSFTSYATNLVEDDNNGWADVFVHDRHTRKTERVSVKSGGGEAQTLPCPGDVQCLRWDARSAISSSGRWVVFDNLAPDLVEGDTNTTADVFIHDRTKRKTQRVSVDSNGEEATDIEGSKPPGTGSWWGGGSSLSGHAFNRSAGRVISGNGRYVTFVSRAENLIPNDTNRYPPGITGCTEAGQDVFVRDRETNRTQRISVTSVGHETSASTKNTPILGCVQYNYPAISSNGRFVVFEARGPLDEGIAAGSDRTYVHDLHSGATESVAGSSVSSSRGCCDPVEIPDISANGRYVSFASDHWPEAWRVKDENGDGHDVFLFDRGQVVGAGREGEHEGGESSEDAPLVCVEGLCIPPGAAATSSDDIDDVNDILTQQGANLYGASLAYRPQYEDLFGVIELEHMPKVLPGLSPIFYGLRFEAEGRSYEVRATSLNFGTFGLFDVSRSAIGTQVADLRGGYGTTGMRVVFSLPLDVIGLESGGELKDVEAFSALGSLATGAAETLDTLSLFK